MAVKCGELGLDGLQFTNKILQKKLSDFFETTCWMVDIRIFLNLDSELYWDTSCKLKINVKFIEQGSGRKVKKCSHARPQILTPKIAVR